MRKGGCFVEKADIRTDVHNCTGIESTQSPMSMFLIEMVKTADTLLDRVNLGKTFTGGLIS